MSSPRRLLPRLKWNQGAARTKVPRRDLLSGRLHPDLVLAREVVDEALVEVRARLHVLGQERERGALRRAFVLWVDRVNGRSGNARTGFFPVRRDEGTYLLFRREVEKQVGFDQGAGRGVQEGDVLCEEHSNAAEYSASILLLEHL